MSEGQPGRPTERERSREGCEAKGADGVSDESVGEEDGRYEGQEAVLPKVAMDPGSPSEREIVEHVVTHWPSRSRCLHCVRGRGRSSPHNAQGAGEKQIPVAAAEYCFVGGAADKEARTPVLVVADSATGHGVCPRGGPEGPGPPRHENDHGGSGCAPPQIIVFKVDQSPFIKAIQCEVAARRPGIKLESSPVGGAPGSLHYSFWHSFATASLPSTDWYKSDLTRSVRRSAIFGRSTRGSLYLRCRFSTDLPLAPAVRRQGKDQRSANDEAEQSSVASSRPDWSTVLL